MSSVIDNIINLVDWHYNLGDFGDANVFKVAFYLETVGLKANNSGIPGYYDSYAKAISAFYNQFIENQEFAPLPSNPFKYDENSTLDSMTNTFIQSKVGRFVLNEIFYYDPSPTPITCSNKSKYNSSGVGIEADLTKTLFVGIDQKDQITYCPYPDSVQTLIHEMTHKLRLTNPNLSCLIYTLLGSGSIAFYHQTDVDEILAIFFENLYRYELNLDSCYRLYHLSPHSYLKSTPNAFLNLGAVENLEIIEFFIEESPSSICEHFDKEGKSLIETLYERREYETVKSLLDKVYCYGHLAWKIGYDATLKYFDHIGYQGELPYLDVLEESYEKFKEPMGWNSLDFSGESTVYTLWDYINHDFKKDELGAIRSITLTNLFKSDVEEKVFGIEVERTLKKLFKKTTNLISLNLSRTFDQPILVDAPIIIYATLFQGIKELNVSNQNLQQYDVDPLLSLRELEVLDVSYNKLTDVTSFTYLNNLRHLDIRNNPIEKFDPSIFNKIDMIKFNRATGIKRQAHDSFLAYDKEIVVPPLKKPKLI